jgi:hypothetical protein
MLTVCGEVAERLPAGRMHDPNAGVSQPSYD